MNQSLLPEPTSLRAPADKAGVSGSGDSSPPAASTPTASGSTERPSAATLESVAALANVSRSTVSRVINGSPDVSEKTVKLVMRAIKELDYVPNQAAKSLASKRSAVVTALIPEDMQRFFGDPFFGSIISGIESHLSGTDLTLNLMVGSERSFQKTLSSLVGGRADGVLILSHHSTHTLIEELETHIPVVYGGRPLNNPNVHTFVDVDNVAVARTGVNHLIGRGCRHIAMITGPKDMASSLDRATGYRQVVEGHGLESRILYGDYTISGAAEAAQDLLASKEPLDGLFAASDLMARGAVEVFLAAGLRIPEDIAVVGVDDSPAALSSSPTLTTVHQDAFEQGRVMAELLANQLKNPSPPRQVYLPTRLIVRESA